MPAAISSATWGDSLRKNHKTPSLGMVFFLPFQETAGVKAVTFPTCPPIKNETGANRSHRRDSTSRNEKNGKCR